MSTNNNEHRPVSGLGFGCNAREIPMPTPEPESKPAAAPSAAPQFRPVRALPPSTRPTLLPFAQSISAGLDNAVARQRLEDAVIGGFLSASEAERLARELGLER